MKKVLDYIKVNRLFNEGDSVVLGVSGGADSICMLHILDEYKDVLGISLYVVHVNHMLRGGAANEDATFVENHCSKMGLDCRIVDVDVAKLAKEEGMSIEEAGRVARYEAFDDVLEEIDADKIAVAHNVEDNSETVLLNLFRGTGIKGLTGISARREHVVRPVLCLTKSEINEYLKKKGIEYRTDASNESTEYTRNKIRLEVMPKINEVNEQAEKNIIAAADTLTDINRYMEKKVDEAYNEYVEGHVWIQEGFRLDRAIEAGLVRKMIENAAGKLKDITKMHILSVIDLKDKQVGKSVNLPYGLIADRVYDGIRILEKDERLTKYKNIPLDFNMSEYLVFDNGKVNENKMVNINIEKDVPSIESVKEENDSQNGENIHSKWFDYDKINTLVLRHRQIGDYIIVDDKGSHKKLKKYFVDEKIPREIRDGIWVLADGRRIVWVVGLRIGEDVKIDSKTKRCVRVEFIAHH